MESVRERRGVTISIFLIDGTPDGMRLSEKSGWTGSCLDFARSDYARARQREEVGRTGIYILFGPDAESAGGGGVRVYVGEGDAIRTRLDQHHKEKDFWTRAFVFTSRDESLNKAHVRYLEARLVGLAQRTRAAVLENGTVPEARGLREAERHDMESYLDEVLVLLPLLGVGAFTVVDLSAGRADRQDPGATTRPLTSVGSTLGEPAVGPSPGSGQRAAEGGVAYFLRERGRDKAAAPVQAEGRDTAQGFVVLAGATGPLKDKVMSPGYARLRASLRQDGTLGVVGNSLRLTRDYPFQSPSAAAAVLTGGNRPGPDVWKDAHGSSLASRRATASEQATVES